MGSLVCGLCSEQTKFQYDPDFLQVPRKRRDSLCCAICLLFYVAFTAFCIFAFITGDPRRLVYPTDYNGFFCGLNNDAYNVEADGQAVAGKDFDKMQYLFFPFPADTQDFGVCVSECPTDGLTGIVPLIGLGNPREQNPSRLLCLDPSSTEPNPYVAGLRYCKYPTEPLLRRCVPDFGNSVVNGEKAKESTLSVLARSQAFGSQVLADLINVWWVFPMVIAISVMLGFTCTEIFKRFAACLVWSIVILFALAAVFFVVALAAAALLVRDDTTTTSLTSTSTLSGRVLAGISFGIVVIIFFAVCFLYSRIKLLIGVMREASAAFQTAPTLVLVPVYALVIFILYFVFWMLATLWIASITNLPSQIHTDETGARTEELPQRFSASQLFLVLFAFFALFWVAYFLLGCITMITALIISQWYWQRDKSSIPDREVRDAIARLGGNYLGSVAFGSLLIATLATIRLFIGLLCIITHVKRIETPGRVRRALLAVHAFLAYLQKVLNYFTRTALIICAATGKDFCHSASQAVGLIARNAIRVLVIDKLGDFILLLAKLAITMLSSATAYLVLYSYNSTAGPETQIRSPITITVLAALLSYLVASMFLSLIELSIDTIMLCFFEDSERHDGSPGREPFARPALLEHMQLVQVESAKAQGEEEGREQLE